MIFNPWLCCMCVWCGWNFVTNQPRNKAILGVGYIFWKAYASADNLGYLETISIYPMRHQSFSSKLHIFLHNIWDLVISLICWVHLKAKPVVIVDPPQVASFGGSSLVRKVTWFFRASWKLGVVHSWTVPLTSISSLEDRISLSSDPPVIRAMFIEESGKVVFNYLN